MSACIPATGQYVPAAALWADAAALAETNEPGLAGVMLLAPDALTKYPGTAGMADAIPAIGV